MIIIGDTIIPSETIINITRKEEIKESKPNSTLCFNYQENLLSYCNENDLNYAVHVSSIKEAIYANALNAKYIITNKTLAVKIQKVAENYMFDSKILSIINSNEEIEEIASLEIDGVIYQNLVQQ